MSQVASVLECWRSVTTVCNMCMPVGKAVAVVATAVG